MCSQSRMIALCVLLLSGFLSSCASTPKTESEDNASTLPWNTPQKWERGGGLGSGGTGF